jgi:hypothetical protein
MKHKFIIEISQNSGFNSFIALFESNEPVDYVFDSLHANGVMMQLLKIGGEIPLIFYKSLSNSHDEIIKKLNWEYKLLEELDSLNLPEGLQTKSIISIPELDGFYNSKDQLEFEEFLKLEFGETLKDWSKRVNVLEFGASGHVVDFLINLGAGLTQKGLERIYKFFEDKGLNRDHILIQQIDLTLAKKKINEIFEVNSDNFRIESCINREEETDFIFFSRTIRYFITINKAGRLIKCKQEQINQTRI